MAVEAVNTYPRNVVWLIEGTNAFGAVTQSGSGIAVLLKKRNDSTRRRFLLTCGHVIRGPSADVPPVDGFGPILKEIRCYPHYSGYVDPMRATPVTWLPQTTTADVPPEERRGPRDWILLDVENSSFQDSVCVTDFAALPVNKPCSIVGYPDGARSFQNKIVTNVVRFDNSEQASPPPGLLVFVGTETRPGMSGGGVFDSDGNLVGIHRARTDAALQLTGVAADHIQRELFQLGWEVVPVKRDPVVAADETASDVSAGVTSLAERARSQPKIVEALRGMGVTITRLEEDLDALQAAKEAHEILLHKLDFKFETVENAIGQAVKEPTVGNRTLALKQIGSIRNDALQLIEVMKRCEQLYVGGVDEANEFLSDVAEVHNRLQNNGADPYQPLATLGIPRIEKMAAQLQRSMTETASHLPFAELQATISGLDLPIAENPAFEGLSKIGSLQDLVRQLVADHYAWQMLHQEIQLLEPEVEKLTESIESAFGSVGYLYKRIARTVARLTNQADYFTEEFVQLYEHWNQMGTAIEHYNVQGLAMEFVEFQNTVTSLFREADQRLLGACQRIASIGDSLRTLKALL